MTPIAWKADVGGAWEDANHWSPAQVPTAVDDVSIPFADITVTSSGVNTASSLTSQATLTISGGSLTVASAPALTNTLNLAGGTFTTSGSWTAPAMSWTGGTLAGNPTITVPAGRTLALSGSLNKVLLGPRLNVLGTMTLTGGGNLSLGLGSVLDVQTGGLLDIQGDESLLDSGSVAAPQLQVEGTLRKSVTAGLSTLDLSVTNQGTMDVETGTLRVSGTSGVLTNVSGSTLVGGRYRVLGTFQFPTPSLLTTNAAFLDFVGVSAQVRDQTNSDALHNLATNAAGGVLAFEAGNNEALPGGFQNAGTLIIGAGSTVYVTGSFSQTPTGLLFEGIGGAPGSGQFGRLSINSNAAVAGRFQASLSGGFVPTPGQVFPVASYATQTGDFSATDGLILPGGRRFLTRFGPNQFLLGTASLSVPGDYDGDGKLDLGLLRPTGDTWLLNQSSAGPLAQQFGAPGDIPVPGDYDGDGKTDLAVYRPSNNTWYIRASTAGPLVLPFGGPGDLPVPGDFDGDGKTDLAVFRPSNGTWYIERSSAGPLARQFGGANLLDYPMPGDYDGDGKTDLAVYRPSTAQWLILQSTAGPRVEAFGEPGLDLPIPADYDGDGKADLAVFRPDTATWYIRQSSAGPRAQQFGAPGDIPVPGDYDGDGKADIAIYRPSTATWYIQQSSGGARVVSFGQPGVDVPLATPIIFRFNGGTARTVAATRARSVAAGDDSWVVIVAPQDEGTGATGLPTRRAAARPGVFRS